MPELTARAAPFITLSGAARVDALNEAAALALEHDAAGAAELCREAYALAAQLGDHLRAAHSLVLWRAATLEGPERSAERQELTRASQHLALARRDREELTRALARHAQYDSLTELHHRRFFVERLALEFARARRSNYPLSVALLHVNGLRRVNAAFSHRVGDEVLRRVAQLAQQRCRETDLVARYGEAAFALLLHGQGAEAAAGLCEQLRAAVSAYDWPALRPGLRVTVSAGVCGDLGLGGPERLLAAAEERLLEARRAPDQAGSTRGG